LLNHLARAKNFIGGAKAIAKNAITTVYARVSCQLIDQEAHAKICMATPGSTLLYPLPQLIILDNDLRVQSSDAWFILNPIQHSFPPHTHRHHFSISSVLQRSISPLYLYILSIMKLYSSLFHCAYQY
jgi:hypothetical protein